MQKMLNVVVLLLVYLASSPIILEQVKSDLHALRLLENGLGRTPQMGWNSWNHFLCNISEDLVRQTADAMVSSGLAELGYKYLIIDDCWGEEERDEEGKLQARASTFPSGIKALADYVHSRGLKFGIYGDAGYKACQGAQPGSLGHEVQDANTFATWGVDYLKYDNCYNDGAPAEQRFSAMSAALLQINRPIFYSICEWGESDPALWAPKVGNSWRTTNDILDTWERIMWIIHMNDRWAEFAGPGGWNDPDMLEVGNGGMNLDEYKVHFSLWALSKAPLIIGCDLCNISSDYLSILSNRESTDELGVQGRRVRQQCNLEVWSGPLSGGRVAVLLLNKGNTTALIRAAWEDIGLTSKTAAIVRDLWQHEHLAGVHSSYIQALIGGHACKMYIMTPTNLSI